MAQQPPRPQTTPRHTAAHLPLPEERGPPRSASPGPPPPPPPPPKAPSAPPASPPNTAPPTPPTARADPRAARSIRAPQGVATFFQQPPPRCRSPQGRPPAQSRPPTTPAPPQHPCTTS